MRYIQYIGIGFLVSLSGSLPLGNLNVSAMQIATREKLSKALWFSAGVIVIEMGYLWGTLQVVNVLEGYKSLFLFFKLLTIALLLVLSIGAFTASVHKDGKNFVLDSRMPRVLLGAGMSLFNPMQVPFWFGWVVYLLSQSMLSPGHAAAAIFTAGAGLGTFAAMLIFIFAGRRFSLIMTRNKRKVSVCMGVLFLGMAIFQCINFLEQ